MYVNLSRTLHVMQIWELPLPERLQSTVYAVPMQKSGIFL